MDEHDCVGDEHERQDHVPLDRDRVEVDEHGDAAQHDLGDNPGHQAERQHGQVAPAGTRTSEPSTAAITATLTSR